ncbi:GGDEF domain-containing phosphodiesterase [Conexibacter woesei]|uniref:GGDEF domain-containing phosphodiesterase n=1 Tax=Conexibacter woesei TaxID=191495 RepID=UPI0018CA529F|nr:GGDEF domain-containing phosphodiesterase [Conexibacter woesei]
MTHANALMRALPDGLLLADACGRIVEVNDALCTMMGYSRDEVLGLEPPYPWWPEDQIDAIAGRFAASMAERSARWELTFQRRDGRRFPVSVASSALAADGDGVAGFASVLRDTTDEHRERERLRAAEGRLRQAQRMADIGSFEVDYRTGEARWSEELFRLLGLPPHQDPQAIVEARARLADPDGSRLIEVANATRADGEPRELLHHYRRGDELRVAEMRIEPLGDEDGERYGVRDTMQDVTERCRAEAEIHLQAHLLDAVDVTVVATDLAGVITHWNRGAQHALGWRPAEAIGRPVTELTTVAGRLGTMADVLDEIRDARQWEGELEVSRRDGTTFPGYVRAALFVDRDGAPAGIVGVCVDVSAQIETERRLRAASDYQRAITDSMGEGLYTLDVDGRLMYLNRAGEELLGWRSFELEGELMDRITGGPGPDGAAVRSHEDVFVRRDDTELAVEVSAAPFETAAGVRGTVVVFKDITERKERERELERQLERISWIGRLRAALAEDRFELHAQPIVDLATGATVQHELLIRLRDEDGTLVAPGRFLPTAERFGLIGDIDQWVVTQGIGYAACGHPVEVNLSAQSLGNPDLLGAIGAELRRTGADPQLLAFEITETAIIQDAAAAEWFITRLRELGCRVALDDFGTGYGGFTYLKRLPIDDLKIDIEFVRDLTESAASQEVVRAVVSLARGFGQRTVAEGVEDDATMDLLRELGVDCAQGFAIARPAPVADVLGRT